MIIQSCQARVGSSTPEDATQKKNSSNFCCSRISKGDRLIPKGVGSASKGGNDAIGRTVDLSMECYVKTALHIFQHSKPSQPQ
jgi:hypothetical protein